MTRVEKKRKQKVEKMNEKFSFLVLQVDGTNTYGLRKCLLKNSCSLIIRKEFQNILRRKLIFSGTEKFYDLPGTWLNFAFGGKEKIPNFRHRHSIEPCKNKLDIKFIKSDQWSLKRSVLVEVNTEF